MQQLAAAFVEAAVIGRRHVVDALRAGQIVRALDRIAQGGAAFFCGMPTRAIGPELEEITLTFT